MKKNHLTSLSALMAILLMISVSASAQTTEKSNWRLGFGLEAGKPTGGMKDFSSIMGGVTARLQYGITDRTALTFTSGYYNFFAKSALIGSAGKPDDVGVVPVKLGVKSFLCSNFYLGAEAGAGFETPGGPVKLLLSPGIGWATRNFDAGIRYENFSQKGIDFGMVALRLAYGFSL